MKWTPEEDKILSSNYPDTTITELSEKLKNRSKSSITQRLKRLGIYAPKKSKKRIAPSYLELKGLFEARNYELLSEEDEYRNLTTKLKYICIKHKEKGILQIDTSHFLDGRGCKYCGIEKSSRSPKGKYSEFDDSKICEKKHLKYVKTTTINKKPYICFVCPAHEELGEQIVSRSNLRRESSRGCRYCLGKSFPSWYIKQHIENNFPIKVESDFEGMNKPLKCYCTIHGEHFNNLAKYVYHKGTGCHSCLRELRSEMQKKSESEVRHDIFVANPDIELVSYDGYVNCESKIPIRCKKCNKEWESTLSSIKANKITCPFCSRRISKGEASIKSYLENLKIPFHMQYSIEDCKGDKKALPFDFALIKDNELFCLIEYQGLQHYQPVEHFGGVKNFEKRCRYDKIKRDYCELNNIPLLCIPYTVQNNISKKINSFLIKNNY